MVFAPSTEDLISLYFLLLLACFYRTGIKSDSSRISCAYATGALIQPLNVTNTKKQNRKITPCIVSFVVVPGSFVIVSPRTLLLILCSVLCFAVYCCWPPRPPLPRPPRPRPPRPPLSPLSPLEPPRPPLKLPCWFFCDSTTWSMISSGTRRYLICLGEVRLAYVPASLGGVASYVISLDVYFG